MRKLMILIFSLILAGAATLPAQVSAQGKP
jgi:hypothetical protein